MDNLAFSVKLPTEFTWHFDGWFRSHECTLTLCFDLIETRQNKLGVGLDYSRSHIPRIIWPTYLDHFSVTTNKGQLVWLPGGNGVYVKIGQDDMYHLMTLHTPLFPNWSAFVSFSKLPQQLSRSIKKSTFIKEPNKTW